MIRDDPQYFFETFRMTPESFQELLAIVGPSLKKQNCVREAISPSERLLMTLAYLVSGDQQKSIAKNYRVGKATVCFIVRETCKSIFDTLKPLFLIPPARGDFRRIAAEFENIWQFPNCIGAIDGKHFEIPAPPNSGSLYHNYKKYFSIILLAVCDANYNFILINNGACGSESDGGIFRRSEFGKRIFNGTLPLPPARKLGDTENSCPHVFVGDEAFPLLQNMMRPFPGDNLTIEKRTEQSKAHNREHVRDFSSSVATTARHHSHAS
ncbi:unnamed protein product [Allacma fusca]|uniref:DDE Tnp4 domain-containing protein n=1 Tax=Allacma fusca TaxID=39272 RepID=A0A8J2J410_9HEXA|nr:unnamed protein product [Allacma fusca]